MASLVPQKRHQQNHYYSIVQQQKRSEPRGTSPLMVPNSDYQLRGKVTYTPVITVKPNSYSISTTAAGSLLQQGQSVVDPSNRPQEQSEQQQPLRDLNQRPTQTQSVYEDEQSNQNEQSRVLISCKKIMSSNGGVLEKQDMIRFFDLKQSAFPLHSDAKSH